MKKLAKIVCNILVGLGFIVALGYAGNMDYEDAVICEMKNNGAYYTLSEQHPNLSESELVELYEAAKNKAKAEAKKK